MVSLNDIGTGLNGHITRPLRTARHVMRRSLRYVRSRPGIRHVLEFLAGQMPKGLYARSLMIIVIPVVLLQSVVAYVFTERHWQIVTWHL